MTADHETYTNGDGEIRPILIHFAQLIPGYSDFTKSKKNKFRKKWRARWIEANDQAYDNNDQNKAEESENDHPNEETKSKENSPKAEKGNKDLTSSLLDEEENEKKKKRERGPKVDENLRLKICDLGNGCWTHHHFSSEI